MVSPPPPCELCHLPSNLFCPPDNAFLCWRCDTVVHSANFLVARHSRACLCRSCASPIPCLLSGPRLPAETQVCRLCSLSSAAGALDEDECSSITQSAPGLTSDSDGSCNNFQNRRAHKRSDRCQRRKERKELSRDLTITRGDGYPGVGSRDQLWQAEASCDGSGVSSESMSAVGYEASCATDQEGTSLMTIRCSFQNSFPRLYTRDGRE